MIKITDKVFSDINMHVASSPTKEICGLIVSSHRKMQYISCRNISEKKENFIIHPEDYANAEDNSTIICIVHSHINVNARPTPADLVGIEQTKLPWLIVNFPTLNHTLTYPSGYLAPYVGRPFVHGVLDCYTIWRDYYIREHNIVMEDYHRNVDWWLKGDDLYEKNYIDAGFVEVKDLKVHDVILMQVASPVINHAAIYIGENKILQHVMGKISSCDVYGGWYRKITRKILRHGSFL